MDDISDSPGSLIGTKVGRYEVSRLLRASTTACIYVANDPLLSRPVMLRIQNLVAGKPIAGRLLRNEALVLAQLAHSGIQRIHDVGQHDDGRIYHVTEDLPGGTLREVLAAATTSPAVLVRGIADVAEAVGYAHRRGYVHRNLSPASIRFDAAGNPRITGFAVAVRADEVGGGDVVAYLGASGYASPEELSQRYDAIGPRSDVWSLGVLLVEVLTGKRPHEGPAVAAMMSGEPPPALPASLPVPTGIPANVGTVALRCLSLRPEDRYADGAEVAAALRGALAAASFADAPRVFVSHSTKDREWVEREVVAFLERNGIPTWYAKADIDSAEQWERTILQGLESSAWFLLVMSPHSAASEWVRDEVFWAMMKRPTRLLPVLHAPCDPFKFHIRLARIQHLDFHADLAGAQRLLLERLTAPPDPSDVVQSAAT